MQAPAPGGGVSAAEETTSCLSSGLLGLLRVSLPEDHFGAASGDMARKISLRLCATASLSENQGKILHGKIEPRGISLSYQKRGCTEDSPKSSPKGMAKGRTHNPRPKITRDGASRWRYGQSPSTSPSPHCGIGTDRHTRSVPAVSPTAPLLQKATRARQLCTQACHPPCTAHPET